MANVPSMLQHMQCMCHSCVTPTCLYVLSREACCSILAVLRRLHDPEFLQSCSPAEAQALQAALPPHDPMLVRVLLGGVVGALPKSRVDDISDVLSNMLQVLLNWLLPCIKAFDWLVRLVGRSHQSTANRAC